MQTKLTSGVVDTLELTEYGEHSHFEGAEIVIGATRCVIILEPVGRLEAGRGTREWDEEDAWRTDVENWSMDHLTMGDVDGVDGDVWLTYDPARDQTESILLGHIADGEFAREDKLS